MEQTVSNSQTFVVIAGFAVVFLMFLPIIIAHSRGRLALEVATILLTGISALGLGAAAIGGLTGGLLAAFLLPGMATCWFAALFCGLVAYLDKAEDRRNNEALFRLLYNDGYGLKPPKGRKMPRLESNDPEQFQRP